MVVNARLSDRDTVGKFSDYKITHSYDCTPVKLLKMGLVGDNYCCFLFFCQSIGEWWR